MANETLSKLSPEEIKKLLEKAKEFVTQNGSQIEIQVMNSAAKVDDQPKSYATSA